MIMPNPRQVEAFYTDHPDPLTWATPDHFVRQTLDRTDAVSFGRTERADVAVMVCEPGDATRYHLLMYFTGWQHGHPTVVTVVSPNLRFFFTSMADPDARDVQQYAAEAGTPLNDYTASIIAAFVGVAYLWVTS